ncbi:S9 family peptidase [Marinimicrobium sp. ABcell2]|uniref:S9 family peptidase n=1 Tax=Marinimicrobium sp. ABcell2 TaxID=3069751 RepID=UPI0027B66CFC|nr:S9 family peptidase [Marinimicrobium sp. ABcell2]MDQ2075399.1 S9 family peptidase [Marinimicrobium sp. ABcell2]
MTTTAPYGSWRSPISAQSLTAQSVRLGEPQLDGDDCYWLESRPQEQGRNALVHLATDGTQRDLLPSPLSVRTRVNEYGGGSYCVHQGNVFFVLDSDQRVYQLAPNGDPLPVSPEGAYRYADLTVDTARNRLICVREDHSHPKTEERHEIVALALDGSGETQILVSGADFYSNPQISPDTNRLSWLSWQHPNMPWDGTECHVARLNERGVPVESECIAGGPNESVFQPQWSPDGELFFVSDRSNWWSLYRWVDGEVETLCRQEAEFATPQWVCGMSTYGFLSSGALLCCYSREGQWQLAHFDLTHFALTDIETGLTDISSVRCANGQGLFLGANPTQSTRLWRFDPRLELALFPIARSAQEDPPGKFLSEPQQVTFDTRDGEEAHGFYYPPHNPNYQAPEGDLPPLLVVCHGGPTGATQAALNVKIQFWTSRGFAVLDVNYRGSTGYGRTYRDRLKGNWGHTDVIDVCSGVDYLTQARLVHPQKCAIRGSSAGGYTVLAALTFGDSFQAGASLYGVGDLESLARDTHKFESRYLDTLVGPYPAEADLYRARSPIHHVERLQCPVIFLQGLEDKIVPPNQAQAMVQALTKKGVPNALVEFPEEGHGFRQAKNIERALEAELYFYGQVFGFKPADELPEVDIANLTERPGA